MIQMEDVYKRLSHDVLFVTSVEHYSHRFKEQSKRLSIEKMRLDDLRKEYYKLFSLVTTPTNRNNFDYGCNFLQMRVNEQTTLVKTIEEQVKSFEMNLFSFLYRPLLICLTQIITYCHYYPCLMKYMVHYQDNTQIDLTKIILAILVNTNVDLLETDKFIHNVYHFPLVARLEDFCSKAIINSTSHPNSYQETISTYSKKFLNGLEERYLLLICQKIAVMLTTQKNLLSLKTYNVWRLDGNGKNILSFLLPESLVTALITKYFDEQSVGKRKRSC